MDRSPAHNYNHQEKLLIFEEDFIPLINVLYNFAYRITLDEDESNDLVQETYLKAFRFINSYSRGTNPKAWLYRILKNSFINELRKRKKEPAKLDYQEIEDYYNSDDIKHPGVSNIQINPFKDAIGDEVMLALNDLAVDFRIVIILCDLEGFTYDEMSKILDIPVGTVRSRLHRARNVLKEKLKKYAHSMGYK